MRDFFVPKDLLLYSDRMGMNSDFSVRGFSAGQSEVMGTLTVTVTSGAIVTDEFWPYVTCLVQPSSGVIADVAKGAAITQYGSPVISGFEILLDGVDDCFSVADSTNVDLPSGAWTIDGFFRLSSMPSVAGVIVAKGMNDGSTYASYILQIDSLGAISGYICGSPTSTSSSLIIKSATGVVTRRDDYHYEYSRDESNNVRLFLNGTLVASGVSTTVPYSASDALRIGHCLVNSNRNRFLAGMVSPVRITKGICRHTSNFIPPSSPYPVA